MKEVKCKNCGKSIEEGQELCQDCEQKSKKSHKNISIVWIIVIGVVILVLVPIFIIHKLNDIKEENLRLEQERYDALPIKVDISMTSYYGTIEYILYELDLDFDLVTMGANCYSGVQKMEFSTEKYGILHTEFRYCKANKTTIFRVYNDESEQELRDPYEGELATFDSYGYKKQTT